MFLFPFCLLGKRSKGKEKNKKKNFVDPGYGSLFTFDPLKRLD